MEHSGVRRLILNSKEFCFSYLDQIITDSYGEPVTLEKSIHEDDLSDHLRSIGFIDCLIAVGHI
jgi:hypothetical protein